MEDTETRELLIRVDSRTKNMSEKLDDFMSEVHENYVRKEEFWPVRMVTYGLMGVIGFGVLGGLLELILD